MNIDDGPPQIGAAVAVPAAGAAVVPLARSEAVGSIAFSALKLVKATIGISTQTSRLTPIEMDKKIRSLRDISYSRMLGGVSWKIAGLLEDVRDAGGCRRQEIDGDPASHIHDIVVVKSQVDPTIP